MKNTVSFSKDSTNLFFHILTACNLSCRHCYINKDQHGENTLSIETIKDWLTLFSHKKNGNVIFLGGEPTLHPELPEAIKKARSLDFKSITVDTNGYLFHDFLSKVTPELVDFMSFSLDGATKETNDSIRGRGCFEKCISGIRESVSKGFNTSMIYTVSNENIHELEMMVPLLKDLSINKFFIQVLGIRGNSAKEESSMSRISKEQWLQKVPETAEKIADLGISVTYPRVFLEEGEKFECAGRVADNYFLFPNNRVYACPLCEDFPFHSYTIKNNRLIETEKINERSFFELDIPEGCVMNKLIQPGNISYLKDGTPENKIACCLLKDEIIIK